MIVTSLRCFARMTVRTPGTWSAVETASVPVDEDELLVLELLPHALSASASATAAAIAVHCILVPAIWPPLARCQRGRTR